MGCIPGATIFRGGEALTVIVANIDSVADDRMGEYTSAKR